MSSPTGESYENQSCTKIKKLINGLAFFLHHNLPNSLVLVPLHYMENKVLCNLVRHRDGFNDEGHHY